jgi:hypothetical protein
MMAPCFQRARGKSNNAVCGSEGVRMSGNNDRSILTRPPKLPPGLSLILGLAMIPPGVVIQGMPGGILVGGGVGFLLMSAWDFGRLRFVAWRRGRAERAVEARAGRT